MNVRPHNGFTLVEIMIVVAIISIALAIAIPNFFRMSSISKKTVCVNNLRNITAAIEQWAIDNDISPGTNISGQQEGLIYDNYLRAGKPRCPSGGDYVVSTLGANPQVQCTYEGEGHRI